MDEDSFRRFDAATAGPLRAVISRVLAGATGAEDLLQETYLRYLGATRPEMDERGQRSYLFRIASHLLHDHFRRKRRRATARVEAAGQDPRGSNLQLRTDLASVLGGLKPKQRELLWLAYVEEATHREIADALGVKTSSIKVLLFRARKKLALRLRQKGLGPTEHHRSGEDEGL